VRLVKHCGNSRFVHVNNSIRRHFFVQHFSLYKKLTLSRVKPWILAANKVSGFLSEKLELLLKSRLNYFASLLPSLLGRDIVLHFLRPTMQYALHPSHIIHNKPVKKVKLSHYRPGQALGVSGGWGSRISTQSAHEGGKVVSPKHRPSLPQEGFLVLIYVRGWVDSRATMQPEGLSHWKIQWLHR
jgi:hypothetical protein